MIELGYSLSSEEFSPADLVENAASASLLPHDDLRGTFAPLLRASESPIAIACFRLKRQKKWDLALP
jgi:hypothetical protein